MNWRIYSLRLFTYNFQVKCTEKQKIHVTLSALFAGTKLFRDIKINIYVSAYNVTYINSQN